MTQSLMYKQQLVRMYTTIYKLLENDESSIMVIGDTPEDTAKIFEDFKDRYKNKFLFKFNYQQKKVSFMGKEDTGVTVRFISYDTAHNDPDKLRGIHTIEYY